MGAGYGSWYWRTWAYQLLFPSFFVSLAAFMTVLLVVAVVRHDAAQSSGGWLTRILIASTFCVFLWVGAIYIFVWMVDTHAYARMALSGMFVAALLVWFFWPDRDQIK